MLHRSITQTYTAEGFKACHFLLNTNPILADAFATQIINYVNSHYPIGTVPNYADWSIGLCLKRAETKVKVLPRHRPLEAQYLWRVFDVETPDTSISTAMRLTELPSGVGQYQTAVHHSVLQTFLNQPTRFEVSPYFRASILHDCFRYLYCYCHKPQYFLI